MSRFVVGQGVALLTVLDYYFYLALRSNRGLMVTFGVTGASVILGGMIWTLLIQVPRIARRKAY